MIETNDIEEKNNISNISENTQFTQDAEDSNLSNNLENVEKVQNIQEDDSLEDIEESYSEPTTIEIEDANTTNCLALTIQKDHKIVAVKNVFIHSIKITWKVIVSTIALTILKLFS